MGKKVVIKATEPNIQESETTQRYTVEQLRIHALKLFGVTQSTYVGATHNLDGEYTVEEMRDHINKWLNKEVR